MPKIRIWTIINHKPQVDPVTVQPSYPDIAARTIELTLHFERLKRIRSAVYMVEVLDDIEGVEMEFHYATMPEDAKIRAT